MTRTALLVAFSLWASAVIVHAAKNLHSFTVLDIDGNEVDLSHYRGKTVLVVNVASACGYTDDNYRWMNDVQALFSQDKFSILAFPCNQFGGQEPGQNSVIKGFANAKKATFDLFSKVRVVGTNAHSVYKYLSHKTGQQPRWNFAKYLVDKNGDVQQFFDTETDLNDVTAAIENLLKADRGQRDDL